MPTNNSPWPKCDHTNCSDDALGYCFICKMDACLKHMSLYHTHPPGFKQPIPFKHDKDDNKNLAV